MFRTVVMMLQLFLAVASTAQQQAAPNPAVDTARRVVDLLVQGKLADVVAMFNAQMKAAITEEKLRAGLQQALSAAGPETRRLEPKIQTVGDQQVVLQTVEFQKAAFEFIVTVNKAGEIAGLYMRPAAAAVPWSSPAYSKAGAFRSEEVTVGKGEWQLPGTLTLPAGGGPFPAIVLVHGSGPNDRDETIGPNKPFRDLAEGLSSRGVAVLRYEKRTKALPGKTMAVKNFTVQQESIDDALAAAELLRSRSEINPARIFVLGHSLGGYLIPRIGRQDTKIAGLISLAGSTRPLEEIIVEQTEYLASLAPALTAEQRKQLEAVKAGAQRLKSLEAGNAAQGAEMLLGVPLSYWLDLKGYDPAVEARSLKQPLLILQGERDYQVTMADFARWKTALQGKPGVVLRSFPALNHLFEAGEGKSKPEEYMRPGLHVAPEVIDAIASWIGTIGS